MSKRRKILLMLAKGGLSQSEVAAARRASKRDASACARKPRSSTTRSKALTVAQMV